MQTDKFIKENYMQMSNKQIANKLNLPRKYVSDKIYYLGLKRPKEVVANHRKNRTKNYKGRSKITNCLKCHEEFKTEIDKMGVPYKKICPDCKPLNSRRLAGRPGYAGPARIKK